MSSESLCEREPEILLIFNSDKSSSTALWRPLMNAFRLWFFQERMHCRISSFTLNLSAQMLLSCQECFHFYWRIPYISARVHHEVILRSERPGSGFSRYLNLFLLVLCVSFHVLSVRSALLDLNCSLSEH